MREGPASWSSARPQPALQKDEVHVWAARLDESPEQVEQLAALLSFDEKERAARFHFDRDRARYIVGRAILRLLVARYCQVEPERVAFGYGTHGKPHLLSLSNEMVLEFNVAHSGGVGVFAFAWSRAVGVDVEQIRPMRDAAAIAERFFCQAEIRSFHLLPPAQRAEGFFRLWTRKEAFIKLLGSGLAYPLDKFAVSVAEDHARLLWVEGVPDAVQRWSMAPLSIAPGYAGAVAVEGGAFDLRCQWVEAESLG